MVERKKVAHTDRKKISEAVSFHFCFIDSCCNFSTFVRFVTLVFMQYIIHSIFLATSQSHQSLFMATPNIYPLAMKNMLWPNIQVLF